MSVPNSCALPPSTPAVRRLLPAGALVVAGLVLGACSSGGPGTGSPAASGPASLGPTTTTAADVSLARSELVPASEFPTGWQGQGSGSENTGASFFGGATAGEVGQIASCLGISTAHVDTKPAEAAEQQYDDPSSNLTVADTVEVFPSVVEAQTDVGAAASPKAPTCVAQIAGARAKKSLPNGMTIGTISAAAVPIPPYGDRDAAVAIHFPFTYQGASGTLYLEFVVVQKGRSESNLQFTNISGAPPSSIVDPLAQDAANALST